MMDKDFELQGEAAERPEPKKLTAVDIPEGFRYAAVDKDGITYAYWECPFIEDYSDDWSSHGYHYKQIGSFDASDWQNSLVSRETAERLQLKKLTVNDIPEGFNYAAVDASGNTVAYYEQPFLAPGDFEWSCYTNEFKPIGVFDASDWKNSLVSRETAERPELEKLTAADIPDGYEYAAVDKDGRAYAYMDIPIRLEVVHDSGSSSKARYKNPSVFIGSDFDASDWQNSLVKRETAERPKLKKLTAADIPEGCLCAAVDSTGRAFGYDAWVYPGRYDWHARIGGDYNEVLIGENFDASDWQNSLVERETAERPPLKKLTAADIPEGYSYAAVDASGNGFTYQGKPKRLNTIWVNADNMDHFFIGQFDPSDWANSLVSRESQEINKTPLLSVSEFMQLVQEIQKTKKSLREAEAIKDQQDKPSFLEIDPNFLEAMAWRMTANKGKYPVNNWKGLTDRFTILDAIYRHANDIKRLLEGGESLTGETIQKHCAAIACNAQFLFYHSPENQWERAARSRKSNAKEI